jgi:raffinose/stachyose/melibiose transport system substrate-binding protein
MQRKGLIAAVLLGALAVPLGGEASAAELKLPEGEIVPREITWLAARPSDGPVLSTVSDIAAAYAQEHPGFKLNIVTLPDRPAYLQKVETLAAARQLPEFFDTDPTPFAQKLQTQGRMVDIGALLDALGVASKFRPAALNYDRFDDGSLYLIPLEFHMEFFWYNTALFKQAGVSPPATLDDMPPLCEALAKSGTVPIALDGVDGWPPQRYIAFYPFRLAGNDFVKALRTGKAKMSDAVGNRAVEWLAKLGQSGCFSRDFSAQGYTDARDLFTQGKAAIYYMGTWELPTLTDESAQAESVRGNISYFTLPTTADAKTGPNEFFVNSGIGMAVASDKFDPLVADFLRYLLAHYPEAYAKTGQFSPMISGGIEAPNTSPLYAAVQAEVDKLGDRFAVPWDTQLDPTSNTQMQQGIALLIQGQVSPKEFAESLDAVIAEEAPGFFGGN